MTNDAHTERQPALGIDLGTTYSAVGYLDQTGRPVTAPNSLGDLLAPSAILVDDDEIVIGKEAVKSSMMLPDSYAECFKRDIGVAHFRRPLRQMEVPPEVLSGLLLEKLKADAELRLGPLRQVVITVPAFFDETRRTLTQEAGRLAGLDVLDIINEPTAAALSYGYTQGFLAGEGQPAATGPKRVLVYDLGGGTFDVTVLEIEGTTFRAVCTDGDVQLGGKDFDERIVNWLADQFHAAHGVDPRSDPQDAAQLWLDAQQAKHSLSERTKATVAMAFAGIRMRVELTREKFEELTRDLLERTRTTTSLVLSQAGMNFSQIERVLLVGGSSRMPMVSRMLEQLAGMPPDRSQSPDEAIAHGAALYCGMLMGGAARSGANCRLVNVNSHSLGVIGIHQATGRKTNVILIPKNTPLPHEVGRNFKTAMADQRSVSVQVVEGEGERPETCMTVGECVVRDLPSGLPQGSPIQVIYRYASNGTLSVVARVPQARRQAEVQIERAKSQAQQKSLDWWRARLSGKPLPDEGGPSAANQAAGVNLSDRASVLKKLDELYTAIGHGAAGLNVPAAAAGSQQMLRQALEELRQAEISVQQIAGRIQDTPAGAERTQLGVQLAQVRSAQEQTRVSANFALLVLGRDCVTAGFSPPGMEQTFGQAQTLRQHLAQRK